MTITTQSSFQRYQSDFARGLNDYLGRETSATPGITVLEDAFLSGESAQNLAYHFALQIEAEAARRPLPSDQPDHHTPSAVRREEVKDVQGAKFAFEYMLLMLSCDRREEAAAWATALQEWFERETGAAPNSGSQML